MTNLNNQMKSKMHASAIKSFNAKYFDADELVRVQDEIDSAETQEELRSLVMEHHLRVMNYFIENIRKMNESAPA